MVFFTPVSNDSYGSPSGDASSIAGKALSKKPVRPVCIVSCSSQKAGDAATEAERLYRSDTFILARRYAQANADRWFIFSAKHGLLAPGSRIESYDQKIAGLSARETAELTRRLARQIKKFQLKGKGRCISLCDLEYNGVLHAAGLEIATRPVEHLDRLRKLEWLRIHTDPHGTEPDLELAYQAVQRLILGRAPQPLGELVRSNLPDSGVYVFFDLEERRLIEPSALRIVRVGTHRVAAGSRATLRDRLRTHLGSASGGGNHRSSIFRLHVGRALMARDGRSQPKSWGSTSIPTAAAQRAREAELEAEVSSYIGNLRVAIIDVPGDASKHNERAYLEQNLIALISNGYRPLDPASHNWLGLKSDRKEIRGSGLWNVNHTAQTYQQTFLPLLNYYVARTLGEPSVGPRPDVSPDWSIDVRRDIHQLSLL